MLFGHCRLSGKKQIVVFTRVFSCRDSTVFVKRTYKGIPVGKEIRRHIKKHGVKIHGENIIRNDYLK